MGKISSAHVEELSPPVSKSLSDSSRNFHTDHVCSFVGSHS